MEGALLPTISSFVQRTEFDDNRFDGPLPPTIRRLAALKTLALSKNAFTGALPPTISNNTQLTELRLDVNRSGSASNDVGQLRGLANLSNKNAFEGTLPPTISNTRQ